MAFGDFAKRIGKYASAPFRTLAKIGERGGPFGGAFQKKIIGPAAESVAISLMKPERKASYKPIYINKGFSSLGGIAKEVGGGTLQTLGEVTSIVQPLKVARGAGFGLIRQGAKNVFAKLRGEDIKLTRGFKEAVQQAPKTAAILTLTDFGTDAILKNATKFVRNPAISKHLSGLLSSNVGSPYRYSKTAIDKLSRNRWFMRGLRRTLERSLLEVPLESVAFGSIRAAEEKQALVKSIVNDIPSNVIANLGWGLLNAGTQGANIYTKDFRKALGKSIETTLKDQRGGVNFSAKVGADDDTAQLRRDLDKMSPDEIAEQAVTNIGREGAATPRQARAQQSESIRTLQEAVGTEAPKKGTFEEVYKRFSDQNDALSKRIESLKETKNTNPQGYFREASKLAEQEAKHQPNDVLGYQTMLNKIVRDGTDIKEMDALAAKYPDEPYFTQHQVGEKIRMAGSEFSTKAFEDVAGLKEAVAESSMRVSEELSKAKGGRDSIPFEKIRESYATVATNELLNREVSQTQGAAEIMRAGDVVARRAAELFDLGRQLTEAEAEGNKDLIKDIGIETAKALKSIDEAVLFRSEVLSATGRALRSGAEGVQTPGAKFITDVKKGEWENSNEILRNLARMDPLDVEGQIKYLMSVKPSTPLDKINRLWYNSVLSGTGTQIANTVGNLSRNLWQLSSKPLRVGTDVIRSAVTGTKREEFMDEWGAEVVGTLQGYRSGVRKALKTFKTGLRESDVENLRVPDQPIKGVKGQIIDIPLRGLQAMDELFREVNKSMEMNRMAMTIAKNEGLTGKDRAKRMGELLDVPTKEMTAAADKLATELLFQVRTPDLDKLGALKDFAKINTRWGELRPMQFVIPFTQTPMNIAKFSMFEASPLGFIKPLVKGGEMTSREKNRQIASAVMGTATLTALASYFTEGKITGSPPVSEKQRELFYAQGKIPNAVKIGNNWVSFNRFPEPIATQLFAISNMYDNFQEEGDAPSENQVLRLMAGFAKGMKERTFLEGIDSLLDVLEDPQRYGKVFAGNLASGFIPFSSFTRSVAKATDPYIRETETTIDRLKSNIPGLRQTLPVKTTRYEKGGESTRKSAAISEFLPPRFSPSIKDPFVEQEAFKIRQRRNKRLQEKSGETPPLVYLD